MDLWRKKNKICRKDQPVLVISLGWLSTVLTNLWLPGNIPMIPANLVSQDDPFIAASLKRSVAKIRHPNSPLEQKHSPLVPGGFQLVCLADMVAGSGALEVLWAFTMVRLAGWPCTLWMAGEGPLLEEYQAFANLASLPDDIRFVPDFRSVDSIPSNPDLVLAPSRGLRWQKSPAFGSSITQITATKNGHQTEADPPLKTNGKVISVIWKPHHICRVIMDSLSQRKIQESPPFLNKKGKSLGAILLEIADGRRHPTPELGS